MGKQFNEKDFFKKASAKKTGKKIFSKKIYLAIAAGVLATVGVIGSFTFGWFTGESKADVDGTFHTAFVDVSAYDMEVNAYDFYPGDYPYHQTLSKQTTLEAVLGRILTEGNVNASGFSRYNEFWGNMPPALGGTNAQYPEVNIFDVDQVPAPGILTSNPTYGNNRVNLIKNAMLKTGSDIWNVTPGCILEAAYNFSIKGESSIPVYFRIPAFTMSLIPANPGIEVAATQRAIAKVSGVEGDATVFCFNAPLVMVGDYYYCPIPLSPEYGWSVDIGIYAYIGGEANGNDIQLVDIGFTSDAYTNGSGVVVEVIQATNNAVFLADGWSDAAMSESVPSVVSPGAPGQSGTFFVPYVDADMYNLYLTQWGY